MSRKSVITGNNDKNGLFSHNMFNVPTILIDQVTITIALFGAASAPFDLESWAPETKLS